MASKKLNHSPFRYPGGKFYARKLILKCIPFHDKYCEMFAGGASIFFCKESVSENILNDVDKELMNCYIQIRDNVEKMIQLLNGKPATKEMHYYYKNKYRPRNDVQRAARYYYLNRTSYSGIMKDVNCYFGYGDKYSMRPENWPYHLRTCSQKLQEVKLFNFDFEKLIDQLSDDFFLFIDPPYFNADQDKFYNCIFSHEEHTRLCNILRKYQKRFTFMITYDDNEEVRDMYSWCDTIVSQEWNYTINRTDDQKNGLKLKDGFLGSRKKGREIFIMNYDPSKCVGLEEFKYDNSPQLKIPLNKVNSCKNCD